MKSPRYSRQGLWSLFLMCAFPLHVWTLILAFRDFSWVTERNNAWDALGVAAYGLVFAFVESAVLFLAATLLGFMVSMKWDEGRRIALLSILALVMALWAMDGQLYFIWSISLPEPAARYIAQLKHPLRFLYASTLALVVPTFLMPVYLVLKSDRFFRLIQGLIERLSLLTMFYLFLDLAGLIVVIIRNI